MRQFQRKSVTRFFMSARQDAVHGDVALIIASFSSVFVRSFVRSLSLFSRKSVLRPPPIKERDGERKRGLIGCRVRRARDDARRLGHSSPPPPLIGLTFFATVENNYTELERGRISSLDSTGLWMCTYMSRYMMDPRLEESTLICIHDW